MDLREKRRQEREKEKGGRRAELVRAAFSCFVEKGIENTSISGIAEMGGVGEATVYRYFSNKENLAVACAMLFWESVEKRFAQIQEDASYREQTGLEQIRMLMETALEIFREEKDSFRFLHDFDGYLLSHQVGQERLAEYGQQIDCLRPYLCDAIEKGQHDGSVMKTAGVQELYYTLTNTIFGLMQKLAGAGALLGSDGLVEGERKMQLLTELLLRGLEGVKRFSH